MSKQFTRFAFYVDDAKVGAINRALSGLGAFDISATPMANAKANGQGVGAETRGDLIDIFMARCAKQRVQTFNSLFVQEFLTEHGRSRNSANYFIQQLRAAKLITAHKSKDTNRYSYTVNIGGHK